MCNLRYDLNQKLTDSRSLPSLLPCLANRLFDANSQSWLTMTNWLSDDEYIMLMTQMLWEISKFIFKNKLSYWIVDTVRVNLCSQFKRSQPVKPVTLDQLLLLPHFLCYTFASSFDFHSPDWCFTSKLALTAFCFSLSSINVLLSTDGNFDSLQWNKGDDVCFYT